MKRPRTLNRRPPVITDKDDMKPHSCVLIPPYQECMTYGEYDIVSACLDGEKVVYISLKKDNTDLPLRGVTCIPPSWQIIPFHEYLRTITKEIVMIQNARIGLTDNKCLINEKCNNDDSDLVNVI